MKDCDLVLERGEAGFEMLNGLRRERNFGEEDKNASILIEAVLSSLKVDFGFSGAGHSVQEDWFWGG